MRQILSTAATAVIVSLLTLTVAGALAQSEPAADTTTTYGPAAVSNINAHRVDGKHAVGAGTSIAKRRGKLVATDKTGFLPKNIVKPLWNLIQGKPGFLADGQVGWDELQGIPASFADGLDNQGVTGATVTRLFASGTIAAGSFGAIYSPHCPPGAAVVGGGYFGVWLDVTVPESAPSGDRWLAYYKNPTGNPAGVTTFVQCLSVDPGANLTIAGQAKLTRVPKRASR